MATIDPTVLAFLRSKGYAGGDQIEDVIMEVSLYLAQRGLYHVGEDVTWWTRVKDLGMLQGKNFHQAIADKFAEINKH